MKYFTSSIGKKFLMALSGIFLIVFIIGHLLGNLSIFEGPEALNSYAEFLRSVPKLLWTVRIGVIAAFSLHIWTSINLAIKNKKARPARYRYKSAVAATLMSRTMLWGGLVVLSFLAFHLAHLTWGWVYPDYFDLHDSEGRHDVYRMTVLGFQNPFISSFYILAQIALAMHLSHGFGSAAQTAGLTAGRSAKLLRAFGIIFAVVISVLYISIPAAVWFGIVTP